jgi:hypothetical protein
LHYLCKHFKRVHVSKVSFVQYLKEGSLVVGKSGTEEALYLVVAFLLSFECVCAQFIAIDKPFSLIEALNLHWQAHVDVVDYLSAIRCEILQLVLIKKLHAILIAPFHNPVLLSPAWKTLLTKKIIRYLFIFSILVFRKKSSDKDLKYLFEASVELAAFVSVR